MFNVLTQFAADTAQHSEEATGGLAALGLNLQSFLFQLISFVIVLVILRIFVYKKIVATLEARRKAVDDSLKHAAETEKKLAETEENIAEMLKEARARADEVVDASHKEASALVEAAETKAVKRAEHIVSEAKTQMSQEVVKARDALKKETMSLVALATEKVIKEKIDLNKDSKLIQEAITKAKG